MSLTKVPTLNLKDFHDAKRRIKFIKDLYESFKTYGFVVIDGHGISKSFIEKSYEAQKKLFSLSDKQKNKYFLNNGGQRGYTPFGTEKAKDSSVKDLKEFWHIGRNEIISNVWPEEIPEFKTQFEKMFLELEQTGSTILEALEESIGLEKGKLTSMVTGGNSILRLLHYPPVVNAEPSAVRAAAHTDINLITLLVSGTTSGLELLGKDKKWIPVESKENTIVVNMGDMLSRICSDHIPSTIHRVINPETSSNVSRYSMPMFIHPRPEVVLEGLPQFGNPKYPTITTEEFLNERLYDIGLKK